MESIKGFFRSSGMSLEITNSRKMDGMVSTINPIKIGRGLDS